MYGVEIKEKVYEMFSILSINEIAKQTNISIPTLYKWKKEYEIVREDLELIKRYRKEKEYNKAIEIGLKFPYDKMIQSQMVKLYIEMKDYDSAYLVGKQFIDYAPIQSQIITMYIQTKEYDKAILIGERFPNYAPIQSQMITIYIQKREYDKALAIGRQFEDNELIQSQMITVYIEKKEYDKALAIGQMYPECEPIQNQMITIYIRRNEYNKALAIGEKFSNYVPIQSQMITIYIHKRQYNNAFVIGEKFPDYEPIQNQIMKIYIIKKEYEKALTIGERFPNYELIQLQMIHIYLKNNQYQKALEVGERFIDGEKIPAKICNIRELLSRMKSFCDCDLNGITELSVIREKLIDGDVSAKEINLLNSVKNRISINVYRLILAAIYERIGIKNKCIELLRPLKSIDNAIIKKMIKDIAEGQNKKYNIEKWDSIIGWSTIPVTNIEEKTNLTCKEKPNIVKGTIGKKKTEKKSTSKEIALLQSEFTIYESLNVKYREMVFKLKLQYYKEMYDVNTRRDATLKYDKLEEILCQRKSNQKAFLMLLLMLTQCFKEEIEKDYNCQYQEIMKKISEKRLQLRKECINKNI